MYTRYFLSILLGLMCYSLPGQDTPTRWEFQAQLGSYSASLGRPDVAPLHPGFQMGIIYHYQPANQIQLIQTGQVGYFYHRDFQHAIQLTTELGIRFQVGESFHLSPLMLGGGYHLSILDMENVIQDPATGVYSTQVISARNNLLLSLGGMLGYVISDGLFSKPTTLSLAYRLQLQSTVIEQTIPLIPYTALTVGISWPIGQ